jgi:hypothetical protein
VASNDLEVGGRYRRPCQAQDRMMFRAKPRYDGVVL